MSTRECINQLARCMKAKAPRMKRNKNGNLVPVLVFGPPGRGRVTAAGPPQKEEEEEE